MIRIAIDSHVYEDPDEALAELNRREQAGDNPTLTWWRPWPHVVCDNCGRRFPKPETAGYTPKRCLRCRQGIGQLSTCRGLSLRQQQTTQ